MSKRKKVLLIVIPVLLLLIIIAAFVTTFILMKQEFSRGEYPDRRFSTSYWYDPDYIGDYSRENVQFQSGENTLQGYIYGMENETPDALIVFAHGIGSGHESYINQLIWFVDHNYRVFTYDATGSCTSEGDGTVGLVQSALDLDKALTYAESDDRLNGLPVLLLGHSWGGYAAASELHFDHDITATCSMSGYSDPNEMLGLGAEQIVGTFFFFFFTPCAWSYNLLTFGKNARLNAVDALNGTDTPALIVHGDHDTYVDYNRVSILSKQAQITNPNVRFLTVEGEFATHNDLLTAEEAYNYKQEWNESHKAQNEELMQQYGGKIPDDVRAEIIAQADKSILNAVNEDLMEEINAFYRSALEK